MPGMTAAEIDLLVEVYLAGDGGYLFGFSYADHERFYTQYCDMPGAVDVVAMRRPKGILGIGERTSSPSGSDQIRAIPAFRSTRDQGRLMPSRDGSPSLQGSARARRSPR